MMQTESNQDTRLSFLQINDDTRFALQEFRPLLEREIDALLDSFYRHIKNHPDAARIFTGHSMDHARKMQRIHWLDHVFRGRFDESYFVQARKIGRIHEQVGLEPRWYLAGYCCSLGKMAAIAMAAYRKKPERLQQVLNAINQAAFLDMDIAVSVYIDACTESAHKLLSGHADRFEQDVGSLVEIVASAATELTASAASMTQNAETTAQQAAQVVNAAERASNNVQTVASATEELSASILEISRQVSQSSQVAQAAVSEAARTDEIMQSLVLAAGKIGDVVKLINAIASQTNLLALNATIEAARAGDAGKGFAVVAGEVKSLANQTARATGEISTQISAVQAATSNAVSAIQGIGGTISHISEIASAIAAAVEQQGAATQDIARNISEASQNTASVTRNIAQVTDAASEAGHTAHEVLMASTELSRQSELLTTKVEKFLIEVRQ